jgi:hypothetical protein
MKTRVTWPALFCIVLAGELPAVTEAEAALDGAAISQSFLWGAIDTNVPLLIGNGDLGGLFDPFGGAHYVGTNRVWM